MARVRLDGRDVGLLHESQQNTAPLKLRINLLSVVECALGAYVEAATLLRALGHT
jgi:hypothetical protein